MQKQKNGFSNWYTRKRSWAWIALFILPIILSIAQFLWDIEARNLKIDCTPERSYWACFNRAHIAYTLLGFLIYPIKLYGWFFIGLFIPVLMAELYVIVTHRDQKWMQSSNKLSGVSSRILYHYSRKRGTIWLIALIAPLFLSGFLFVWEIAVIQKRVICESKGTWLVCFDEKHRAFLQAGLEMYIKDYYGAFFLTLSVLIFLIEIYFLLNKDSIWREK